MQMIESIYRKRSSLRQIHMKQVIFILLFFLSIPGFGISSEPVSFQRGVKTGTILDPMLSEVSGIFSSWKNSRIIWAVNDSGNPPELYAVSSKGKLLKIFSVEGADNTDWEDLSGFRYRGKAFLVIGDIGDNNAHRDFCTLYAVEEPEIRDSTTKQSLTVQWRMRFQYADGPKDCEALAIDVISQRIYLMSKREKYPTLYELPLSFSPKDTVYTATPVAQIRTIPQPTLADLGKKYGKYRSQPTAMDISPNGRRLVILTYKHGYLFERDLAQTWGDVFKSQPETLPLPLPNTGELIQREALCINPESGSILVTTEQIPAPIYTLAPRIPP